MKELLKKKSTKAALLLIVVAVIAIIVGMNVQSAQKEKEYNAHIEAAEKYLTELDYEQAIAEYTLALEIEPNSEEVLNGLEKTYLAYADALAEEGEYEKAIQVLNEGYAQIGRESLQEKIAQIQEMQAQAEEEQAQAEALKSYMQQMYDLMAAEDYSQAYDLAYEMRELDTFDRLIQESGYLYFPQGNDEQTGIGVGIYPVHDWNFFNYELNGKYAFYYGNFVNGKREDKGVSLYYGNDENKEASHISLVFIGEWKNDAPNGYGEMRWLDNNIALSGSMINGLWDGTVTEYHYYDDGYIDIVSVQVINGIPEDKTEEYLELLESLYGTDVCMREREMLRDEDKFVYACSLVDDNERYSYSIKNGETKGIWEFANRY